MFNAPSKSGYLGGYRYAFGSMLNVQQVNIMLSRAFNLIDNYQASDCFCRFFFSISTVLAVFNVKMYDCLTGMFHVGGGIYFPEAAVSALACHTI